MMTSSNGNIFRVTGHLCGNSPVAGEFPAQRPVTRSFNIFFNLSSRRPSFSVLHFCVYFDRASHFITSNCISELVIFMCVYTYIYVSYVIPQYHVFIVYINPITTFIVYIITFYSMFYAFDAIMFYCTLSEITRIKMINQSNVSE